MTRCNDSVVCLEIETFSLVWQLAEKALQNEKTHDKKSEGTVFTEEIKSQSSVDFYLFAVFGLVLCKL